MHFCTAKVMVAGDKDQVVYRDEYSPVSWPEAELLRSIHGDDAVLELKPFVHVEQNPREERARLVLRYGREYVDACFPGRGGNIMTDAPEADIAYGARWKNPLTQLEEVIPESLSSPSSSPSKPDLSPSKSKGGKSQEATL